MKAFAKRARTLLMAGALALSCAVLPLFNLLPKGKTELTASAAGTATVEAYRIKNVTQNREYAVTEKNSARLGGNLIYFDKVWADKHGGGTDQNPYGAEVKVELEDGKYIVKEIVADNVRNNMTIPDDGFVLSGNGTAKDALLEFAVNDEVEVIDNARFKTINQSKGLEVVVNAKNRDPVECANVWTSANGTATPSVACRARIICEKASGKNLYTVREKQNNISGAQGPISAEIPAGGIVIDMHSATNNYAFQKGCFFLSTEVGDTIYFEDTASLEAPGITVKSGSLNLAVDGLNATLDNEIVGKSLIYTNMSENYKTIARTDETVKEYTVQKDGDAWKVTGVAEESQNVIPDYDGFVLSIPSTVAGYDSLSVDDTVTLEGTFDQKTAFAANIDTNHRVFIDVANTKARPADTLVIYDDTEFLAEPQEGYAEPVKGFTGTNENGVEIQVTKQDDKYIVTQKTSLGQVGNLQIPENGFVLSGHGVKGTELDIFKVGDEVHIYDRDIASNTKVTSILNHGETIDEFDPDTREYNIIVYDGDPVPEITCTVRTRMGQSPTVQVNGIETQKGTVTIEVTAPDGSVGTYTLKFDRAYGTNRNLSSVTVGGVALKEISANMTYTIAKGAALPKVEATAEDERATVAITDATAENKVATIVVTADDTSLTKTYKITFVEANTSLSSITIDGVALDGFSADTLDYTYTLAKGTQEVPTVAATAAESKATVSVKQAEDVAGKAEITVTIGDFSATYTIQFKVAAGGGNNVGMIVGIVVGAVVIVAAAGVAVFFVMKKRGKNK